MRGCPYDSRREMRNSVSSIETRPGIEPGTTGLQPASRASETRAMVSPGRFERPTFTFGR